MGCKGCGNEAKLGEAIRDHTRHSDQWTHVDCLNNRLAEIDPSDRHREHIMRSWSDPRIVGYNEQSASWQEGYDAFYEWDRDDSDAEQFANEPAIGDHERDAVSYAASAHADYHRGWDHANYENAYEGYQLAKGGLSDS